jgi:RNA polymerase sigma factor (sigma-70 family)
MMSDQPSTNMLERSESDASLAAAFARERSQSAFASLVERHAGWVYAAAYRQLRDHHAAEDATQAVFILLSQQIHRMSAKEKLSGWLFLTLGYTVKSIERARRRRERYEKLAAMERAELAENPPEIAAELDGAVARLPEDYRVAVLLRFYRGMEFANVGRELGISEAAARKRVERGIDRLRQRLGGGVSAESLAVAAAVGRPEHLAAICGHAMQAVGAGSGTASAGATLAAKGAVSLMAAVKLKIAIAAVLVVLCLASGAGVVVYSIVVAPAEPPKTLPVATPPARSTPVALSPAQLKLQEVYGLQKGEVFKLVQQPFIEERRMLYEPNGFTAANGYARPLSLLLNFYNGKFSLQGMAMADKNGDQTRGGWTVKQLAEIAMNLDEQDIEGDATILGTTQMGDIVYDPSFRESSRMQTGLEQFLSQTLGEPVRLTFRNVERPVIVFRGTWHWNGNHGGKNVIELYGASLGADPKFDPLPGSSIRARFTADLGTWIHESVFIDATGVPRIISWHENSIGDGSAAAKTQAHDLKLVCDHVAKQTGLTWTQETRSVRRLFVEKAN